MEAGLSRHANGSAGVELLQVQHTLVLRRIGVALLHDVVAPREIAVELAARSRRARDHQAPVPVVR